MLIKDGFYHDQYLNDMFLSLIIEIFGCLDQQVNDFFHWCVVMTWRMEGIRSHLLLVWRSFYRHRGLVVLHQMHATSILRCITIISEESSRPIIFSMFFPSPYLTCFLRLGVPVFDSFLFLWQATPFVGLF